jgi:hypothetical protein
MPTVTKANLQAYLNRDWAKARQLKTAFVRDRIVAQGPKEALRYMDALRVTTANGEATNEINQINEAKTASVEGTHFADLVSLVEKIREINRCALKRLIGIHRERF